MNKEDVTHNIYNIDTAIEKNKILPFATAWMDTESIMLSEISQLEKAKYHMISHRYGI